MYELGVGNCILGRLRYRIVFFWSGKHHATSNSARVNIRVQTKRSNVMDKGNVVGLVCDLSVVSGVAQQALSSGPRPSDAVHAQLEMKPRSG